MGFWRIPRADIYIDINFINIIDINISRYKIIGFSIAHTIIIIGA